MRSLRRGLYSELAYLSVFSYLVCMISGIVLSFHYFPDKALVSLLALEAKVPYGKFYRSLHYFSAQITLISLFFHLLDSIYLKVFLVKSWTSWLLLGLSFFGILYITFTGYLLRGDEVGELAGSIAGAITRSFPLLGPPLNKLFFALSETGLHRAYLWHIYLSFVTICGLLLWHVQAKRLFSYERLIYGLIPIAIALVFYPPLVPLGGKVARGPWFLIGAQSMLKLIPAPIVFAYLLALPVLYQSFSYFKGHSRICLALFIAYFLLYLIFTVLWFW